MTIWESVDGLQEHPLLFRALNNVKAKIENCLSRYYSICDSDGVPNHKNVLLNLPGSFLVAPALIGPVLPGAAQEGSIQDAYEECGSDGITFNRELVMASTAYFNGAAVDDLTTNSYVAVFEETIEHELAHLKMHQEEKLGGSFAPGVSTPDGRPYLSESGYAVQRNIRARAAAAEEPASILEVSEASINQGFAPPLGLYRIPLSHFNDEDTDITFTENPLSEEEIDAHMKYPNDCVKEKRERDSASATGAESGTGSKRSKADDGGDPATRETSTSPRRSMDHRAGSARGGQERSGTDETGQDRDERRVSKRIPDFFGRSAQKCSVQVVFCDENRDVKTAFLRSDRIYVLMTFRNSTTRDTYANVPKFTFARGGGIFMTIDGCPLRNTRCRYGTRVPIVRIPAGEAYTFFRLLCVPPEDALNTSVRLATPQEPGDYVARVMRFPSFEFPGSSSFLIAGA